MSRLDSFIRRMCAQRAILDAVAAGPLVPGMIAEIGLGSGRTYDHLRERFPARRIVVFESVLVDGVLSRPAPEDLVVGDVRRTAAGFADGCAALVHADIETGDPARDAALDDWLPALVARLLAPGGLGVSGSPLPDPRLAPRPLPPGVEPGRYHLVQRL